MRCAADFDAIVAGADADADANAHGRHIGSTAADALPAVLLHDDRLGDTQVAPKNEVELPIGRPACSGGFKAKNFSPNSNPRDRSHIS